MIKKKIGSKKRNIGIKASKRRKTKQKTILVTGSAGFIGFHVAKALLDKGFCVLGMDDFNDYYDPQIKEDRNSILEEHPNYQMFRIDITNFDGVREIFKQNKVDQICHLAARAGVRYSIEHPFLYGHVNIMATINLLELCKEFNIKSFIFASSSSVYGGNKMPFSEKSRVDTPISPYAATKKSMEMIAHTYHYLYKIHITGLRFFTVYGPWGRPDMALFKFAKNINQGKTIDVYNYGNMKRDFTYIDDIVAGILLSLEKNLPYEIFNLGNNNPTKLGYFIECIEKSIGKKAKKKLMPMQPGDIPASYADVSKAKKLLGWTPKTNIEKGIDNFIKWYKDYNKKGQVVAIIPGYNEQDHVFDVVKETKKYVDKVIVVDDGSKDKTFLKAQEAGADLVLRHIMNMRKGMALKTGFEAAIKLKPRPQIIVCLDADGQHDPSDIPRLVKKLRSENLDIVIGSRQIGGKMPFLFKFGNFGLNNIFTFLFKLKIDDTQSGFRAIKTEIYNKIRWDSRSYGVETEMLAKAGKHKLKCAEIPIKTVYLNKVKGTTVIDGIRIFFQMMFWKIRG